MVTGGADAMQDIRFARSADGVCIAYAVHGSGPPLLIDACWLSHLQFDWQSPVWRHFLVDVGRVATVIRYDERGHGLSDRGLMDHGLEARVADLEAVADHAGLERFALMAMAQGGPVAIEYAARHPERLTRLIFYGSFAGDQPPATPEEIELFGVMGSLIKVGWARPTSEFRRVFSSMMIPGGTEEQMRWIDDLQRMAVDADTALLARSQRQVTDSTARLDQLDLPTLVLHSRGDQMQEFGRARHLAASIQGAKLVALESNNHIVLADEPAWPVFLREVTEFLAPDRTARVDRCRPTTWSRSCRRASSTSSGWRRRAGTTTRSPPSWCCRYVRSSGICRTRTPSSVYKAEPRVRQPSRGCLLAPDPARTRLRVSRHRPVSDAI